jgi:hypothetical protein
MPDRPQRPDDIALIIEGDNVDVDELNRLGQKADKDAECQADEQPS